MEKLKLVWENKIDVEVKNSRNSFENTRETFLINLFNWYRREALKNLLRNSEKKLLNTIGKFFFKTGQMDKNI